MKTHTARWFRSSPTTWILKARACDGGAVLATVREYVYSATWEVGGVICSCDTRYAAQRAARRALKGEK